MKNFYPILFLFAAQCKQPVSVCETPCGMWTDDLKYYTCEDFQRTETLSVLALQKTRDPRLQTGNCALLGGIQVEFMPTERWIDHDGLDVRGRFYCGPRVMRIGREDKLTKTSLTHEIAHALQDCTALEPVDPKDPHHSQWREVGILDAIQEVSEQ